MSKFSNIFYSCANKHVVTVRVPADDKGHALPIEITSPAPLLCGVCGAPLFVSTKEGHLSQVKI